MRTRAVVGTFAASAVVVAFGAYLALRTDADPPPRPRPARACVVEADGQVALDEAQMANAATIAAVGIRRGLPERAVVVALATAFQESKLENLAGGDRDSIGLFQQRPSQGWGTPQQIRDPRYAAGKFYSALVKVKGWQQMRVTDAAQRVQRSAFPEAYEKWADESVVLATALLGNATGAVACAFSDDPRVVGDAATAALTRQVQLDWGQVGTATEGDLVGLTLTARDTRHGWQYAHWLVSHSAGHGIKSVRYADREWTARGGTWSTVSPARRTAPQRVVAEVFAG